MGTDVIDEEPKTDPEVDLDTQADPAEIDDDTPPEDSADLDNDNDEPADEPAGDDPDPENPLINEDDPKGVKKRIGKATRMQREAERDRDFYKERALQNRPEPVADKPPADPEPAVKPKVEDFETDEAFMEALTDYKVDQRLDAREQDGRARDDAAEQQAQFKASSKRLGEQCEALAEEHDDFRKVVMDLPQLPVHVQFAVMDADESARVLYHLAKNPKEAAAIAEMTPMSAARAVGRIETKVTPKRASKTVTDADPPPKELGGNAKAEEDPGKMSDADWFNWRARDKEKKGIK